MFGRSTPPPPCRTALVLGGGSDLALASVRALALRGLERVVLACRDPQRVASLLAADPLPVTVAFERWDALEVDTHEALISSAAEQLGGIDLVLCAVGSLGHGSGITGSPADAAALIQSNFTGPAAALTAAAHRLIEQRHGVIVVISSVAALRARKSNYLYGAAKAGLDTFASGLTDALRGTGVRVHLIRPGFVHTRMTTGLKPAPFAAQPAAVAVAIADAVTRPSSSTVHVPSTLGPLFGILRLTPRPLWRLIAGDR